MKRARRSVWIAIGLTILLTFATLLRATLPHTTVGAWSAAGNLSQARSNASAVMLSNGSILIVGGEAGNGALQSTEIFGTDGSISSAAPMYAARSRHFAVLLSDGRVLVGGGITSGGGTTNTAEIYDSSANTWTPVGVMTVARANATAAALSDGRVVIAGGDNAGAPSNTIEIFDPSSGSFSFAATMSASRTQHAMAVLQDDRVLIIGGTDGSYPLSSSDIFDPSSGNVSAGPNLATARYAASATTLLDGDVAVIGGAGSDGNGGTTDLASIEVFDPSSDAVISAGANLVTPREGHRAFLLPNNNNVLIVGGTAGGKALSSSELFTAQASSSNGAWSYSVSATRSMNSARAGSIGSTNQLNGPTSVVAPKPGYVLMSGGTDATDATLASSELYAYPTVQTDRADYPPGTTVSIIGGGFQPNETVNITLIESPLIDTHGPYTVTADGNGNIANSSFTTDLHDESVRFFMSATGNQSGRVAQNSFTDAISTSTALTSSLNPSTYGQSVTFTATATQTGGSPVTEGCITLQDGNNTVGAQTPVNASSGTVTWIISTLAAGSHNLQANYQDGNKAPCGTTSSFGNSHGNVTQTVNPKVLTVTAITANDHVYDGTKNAILNFTGATLQGIINGDSVTLNSSSYTATFASKDVATGIAVTITGLGLTGAQAGDYTLTQPTGVTGNITPKALSVSGITVADHVYDGTTSATLILGGASLSGVLSGDTVTLNSSSYTASFASKNVGSGIAVVVTGLGLSGAQAGDYTLAQPAALTGNITKRAITVAAATNTKPYDGTTSAAATPSITTGSLVSSDTANFTEAYTTKNAGTGLTLVPSGSVNDGNAGNNYAVTFVNNITGVITARAITVTAATNTKPYDGTTSAAATPSITTGSLVPGDTANLTESYSTKNVGTSLTLTPSGTVSDGNSGNNYAITFVNNTTGVISARPITVTAATNSKQYDGTNSAAATPTITIGSLASGDTANFTEVYTSKNAGTGLTLVPTGSVSDGNNGSNYAVTFANNTIGVITARPITVNAASNTKEYDGTTSAAATPTITSGSLASGDTANFTEAYTSKNAGTGLTLVPTGSVSDGNNGGNYAVTFANNTAGVITARAITVTAATDTKVYDGTASSSGVATITSGSLVSGDTAVFTQVFDSKNAGSRTLTPSGSVSDGSGGNNYSVTFKTAPGSITARPLTVTATGSDKQYDGTTAATVTLSDSRLSGDSFTESYSTAVFANKNVGTGKTITVSGISISGTDADNYSLSSTTITTSANITARALTVTATGVNKQYDGTTAASVTLADNRLPGDSIVDSYTSATFADANSGSGKTVSVIGISISGTDSANYSPQNTTTSTTAHIAPAVLTLAVTGASGTYNALPYPAVCKVASGLVGSDSVGLSITYSSVAAPVNVGSYTATCTSSGNPNYSPANAQGQIEITSATLTITANNATKNFGDIVTFVGTEFTATGLLGSDSVTGVNLTSPGTDATASVAGSPYPITPSAPVGTGLGNYTITYVNGTLTVNKATFKGTVVTTADDPKNVAAYGQPFTATVNVNSYSIGGINILQPHADPNDPNTQLPESLTVYLVPAGGNASQALKFGSATAAPTYDNTTNTTGTTKTGWTATITGPAPTPGNYTAFVYGDDPGDNSLTNAKLADVGYFYPAAEDISYPILQSGKIDVVKATVTGNFSVSDKTYDATTAATITSRSLTGVIGKDDASLTDGTATFSDKNVGSEKIVTGTGFTLSGSDAANYTLVSGTLTTTANIAPLTVTGSFTVSNKTYDASTTANIATRSLNGVLGSDSVSLTGGTASFSDKNVGTGKIVTGTGFSLTGTDAGSYALASTSLTTTADITAVHIVGTFTAATKMYDGTTAATVSTRLVAPIVGDNLSLIGGTANFSDKNVGLGKTVTLTAATLGGADAGNYVLDSVVTAKADITALHITGKFTAQSKQYDGNTSATVLTEVPVGAISNDNVSLTGGTAIFSDKNVGARKTVTLTGATLSGMDAGNYILDSVATTTADITAMHITGSFTAQNKIYDGNNSATVLTRSLVGAISADSISLNGGTANFADKNVGTGKTVTLIGATLTGTDAGNYVLDSVAPAKADITALHITGKFTVQNKQYDGNTSATVTAESLVGTIAGDNVSLNGGTATFSDKNVGMGKTVTLTGATLSGMDSGNYILDSVATTTADITALHLTGTFTADNKVYDGSTSAMVLTRSLNVAIGTDAVSLSGGTATFSDKNVGKGKMVTLSGTSLSGNDSANYVLDSVATTTADITARPLTVTATGVDKVYDGTTTATVTLSDNRVGGDVFTDSYTSASFSDKAIGNGKTMSVAGILISGKDAPNYTFNTTAVTAANITPRTLSVTATAAGKTYDGTATAIVTLSDNRVTGDVLTESYGSATFADKNVGTNKPVGVTGIAIAGTDSVNYSLSNTTASGTADITERVLTVTATGVNKIYDGAISATVTLADNRVSGDVFIDSYATASFTSKTAEIGKTVNVTGISIIGTDAGNYTFNTTALTTANITLRTLTVTATAADKTYDGTATATVTLSDNHVTGDVLTDSYASATFADKTVGTGKTVIVTGISVSGADASNYSLSSTTATAVANIKPAPLTITAKDASKTYGATLTFAGTEFTSAGLVSGDTVASVTLRSTGSPSTATPGSYSIAPSAAVGTDLGNYTISYVNGTLKVLFATGGMCTNGLASHIILQPINSDGTSVFKAGSTVPTKFVVCDASGNSVGPNTAFPNSSVVKSYIVAAASNGTVSGVDETQYSTTPDTYFRWDPTAQQWIFNQATGKSTNLTSTGVTYLFQITLIDGTVISGVNNFNMVGYQYGLK